DTCALWRWTGLEKPGGKSTVYIRACLPGNPARSFVRSGVIVSCAIGGVTAFCAISEVAGIALAMRNASITIGFELVLSCAFCLASIGFNSLQPTLSLRWIREKVHNADVDWSTFINSNVAANKGCLKKKHFRTSRSTRPLASRISGAGSTQ